MSHFRNYMLLLGLLIGTPVLLMAQKTASISIDLEKRLGPMYPAWSWFGYDEPNYTYMKDGKKLLSELSAISKHSIHVRTHSLLVTGNGQPALKWGSTNIYTEDLNGNPVYDFKIIDSIFDTYVQRGIKPLAQIGFMPEALSTKPKPYQHHWEPGKPYNQIYTGWTMPPNNYLKWAELIFQWVKHAIGRYGAEEVASWHWELWNEPDSPYWGGSLEEYLKLYDYSADAVKRALPSIKIGGPHVTGPAGSRGGNFLKSFMEHCANGVNAVTGKKGAPLDFIAFHAKGSPRVVNGYVRMDMGRQLRDIRSGFDIVASNPNFKHLPIIIGESDPEGCAACGMATNPENAYRNGTMYSSYTAASFARKYALADFLKVNFLGAVSWSFEFENQPWFYGFRDLATNGIDKPVLNVFRMFGKMQGNRLAVEANQMLPLQQIVDSSVRKPIRDLGGFATAEKKSTAIMLWNYQDDDLQDSAVQISVQVKNIPTKSLTITHYRIDKDHSNSYEVWKKMGSPQQPTVEQISTLEKSGQLQMMDLPKTSQIKNGIWETSISMPTQAVSLFKIDWK